MPQPRDGAPRAVDFRGGRHTKTTQEIENQMAQIKIKQIKSRIGAPAVQKRTLDALGLKKMNHTVVKEDTPSVMGMVNRVRHLVEVTNA